MKIYITGPMTGYEELNFPRFEEVTLDLRASGFEVVSPHEIKDSGTYDLCLIADLKEMLSCDALVTIEGWAYSRGARLEVCTAIQVGIPIIDYREIQLEVVDTTTILEDRWSHQKMMR